jgi:AP2 domain
MARQDDGPAPAAAEVQTAMGAEQDRRHRVNVRDGRTRKGTRVRYYDASWVDETGSKRKRTFSVAKYGESRARAMAIRTRKQVLAELLRPGAPYPASLAGRR